MAKILYIDVETTGLDPKKHSIVQCSGIIEIDDAEKERFDLCMRPRAGTEIDPKALKVIGNTEDQLNDYPGSVPQYVALCRTLGKYIKKFKREDKFFFAGYNAHFDMGFMRAWWEAVGDVYFGSWFYFPPLDIMTIAANEMMDVRAEMKDFKLHTVCERLGLAWDEESAHDAMYDVEKTMELHERLEEWVAEQGQLT